MQAHKPHTGNHIFTHTEDWKNKKRGADMSIEIINDDICNADCDIIVNAANGIGFMGGVLGWFIKFSGVSENLNYNTKGKVEREACIKCLKHYLIGYMPGNIYVTKGYNLKCKYIFHAVTMWLPGTFSTKRTINKLLPKILDKAKEYGALSIAIPLLGTGVGRLNPKDVMEIYHSIFDKADVAVKIYVIKE